MVTYKTKKAKQGNYLTPKTNTGKKALKYLHKYCEKTLAYCQQQGLTTLEDFAEALESISEEDNPKLKIAVEVNTGGIAMKLANKPELGTTTGKYMMQHLGFDEEEQGKFTRTGIEQALNPEQEREDEDEIDDLLDSFEGETEELEEIDDRPDEAKPQRLRKEPRRVASPPEKSSPQVPHGNGFIDYDSLLDRAAVVGAAAANQGNELDGANLNGLGVQVAALAAIVGKKNVERIIAAAKKAGREKEIAKIAERLQAAYDRTDELLERSDRVTESSPEEPSQSTPTEEGQETPQSANEVLAEAIADLDERINRTQPPQKKSEPFSLDKNANFDEQLKQLNAALDRIERRLDALEARIEGLEKAVREGVTEETPKSAPVSQTAPDEEKGEVEGDREVPDAETCAEILLNAYNIAEQQAAITGESIEDGIVLGESAILYAMKEEDSTTISIESMDGEELFAAIQEQGEWEILTDRLSDRDKQEIATLRDLSVEVENENDFAEEENKQKTEIEIE